jgi:hypothetical protein
MQRIVVRSTVHQHTVVDSHKLTGRSHQRRLPIQPLSHLVIEPCNRSIIPEMHHHRLNHHPLESPAFLPCNLAMPPYGPNAPCAGNQPRIARQMITAAKTTQIAYLRLDEKRGVVARAFIIIHISEQRIRTSSILARYSAICWSFSSTM